MKKRVQRNTPNYNRLKNHTDTDKINLHFASAGKISVSE